MDPPLEIRVRLIILCLHRNCIQPASSADLFVGWLMRLGYYSLENLVNDERNTYIMVDTWSVSICGSHPLSRVVHGPDGPAGRVGSRFCRILAGRVTILPDFSGSGQHFGFCSFFC